MATDYKKAYAANPFSPSNPLAWLGWYIPLDRDHFATIEAKFKSTSKAFDRFAEFESVRFAKGVKRAMLDRLDILAPREGKRRRSKNPMTKQQFCRFTGLCSRAANLAMVTGQAMALSAVECLKLRKENLESDIESLTESDKRINKELEELASGKIGKRTEKRIARIGD